MKQSSLFGFSLDNALEMIIVFSDKGKILYANKTAKKQLDYGEELNASLITDIFPGKFRIDEGISEVINESEEQISELMAYRKNRTCFPVRVKFLLYENELSYVENLQLNKDDCIYICTAYDASTEVFLERKAEQAGQEAEKAQKVKSEFVANVTHELRTPVNGILGNTQELISHESDKEKLKLLRLVERGCRDMNAIINNILDFSKLEAGKFVLEPRKFHFRNMVDYVNGNHSNRIIEKGLEFTITVSPDVPENIIGDELRIVQVLNNLISNAYKFTSVGGIHVEIVKTAQSGNRMELFFMVIDSGIGIAKADQDKLFKSFSQVDASISRKYGGTGLGLNISKQLVELMGGCIHVQSDVGKGSIFSFDIWVEIPNECVDDNIINGGEMKLEYPVNADREVFSNKLQKLSENYVSEKIWQYGEPENKKEIDSKMSKLILSIEMENWEKAETFTEAVKQLLEDAPREIKSGALRLKMAVQKGDYEKAITAYENLQRMME